MDWNVYDYWAIILIVIISLGIPSVCHLWSNSSSKRNACWGIFVVTCAFLGACYCGLNNPRVGHNYKLFTIQDVCFYTGVFAWSFVGLLCLIVICVALKILWDTTLRPSFSNLWIAIVGKSFTSQRHRSYYEIWSSMERKQYYYFTKGKGNHHFARCAIKRLVYEARKESLCIGLPRNRSYSNWVSLTFVILCTIVSVIAFLGEKYVISLINLIAAVVNLIDICQNISSKRYKNDDIMTENETVGVLSPTETSSDLVEDDEKANESTIAISPSNNGLISAKKIEGWLARDWIGGNLVFFKDKPTKRRAGMWEDAEGNTGDVLTRYGHDDIDIDWESEPVHVELSIIKK